MAWWEGVEESRVFIAPDSGAAGNGAGSLLSLRHPKTENRTCYLLNNGLLQELYWYKKSYGSWFLGEYVCEDGGLYIATPIDPVFILLPIFEEARMKKGDDPGKFRSLDEILFISDYPGYQHLMSIAENCMQVVCEIKEIGSSKFYRLDDTKVLGWLCYKVCQLKKTLPALDQNYAARNDKDTLADAVSIVAEYLKDQPWLKLLCDHFKLNLLEATTKPSDLEVPAVAIESKVGYNLSQGKNNGDRKTARNAKQSKKAKLETESKNIKEMFTRASRRRG